MRNSCMVMYFHLQAQIPTADTTYWCAAYELPQEVQQQERYVIRVSTLTS